MGALTGGTTGLNQTVNNYLLHEEPLARSRADQARRSGDAQACQTRDRLDQLSQSGAGGHHGRVW